MRRDIWAQLDIFCGGDVKRFHTWPTIGQQTVAEHSWGVLAVLDWLYEDASRKLLRAAIYHDVSEYVTGDIPFIVKRVKPEVKKSLVEMEDHHHTTLKIVDMDLDEEDRRRLKVADYIECILYCIRQKRLGSQTMGRVMVNLIKALSVLVIDEERQVLQDLISYYNTPNKDEEDHA